MATKKKVTEPIPSWFSPHGPPSRRYIYVPQKMLEADTEVSRISVSDGDILDLKPNTKYKVSTDHELEWGSCYYPNDYPSIISRIDLIEFISEELPNPNYKSQLKRYNEQLDQIETWPFWKIQWDEEEARRNEISERRELAKLKKKYEKNPKV